MMKDLGSFFSGLADDAVSLFDNSYTNGWFLIAICVVTLFGLYLIWRIA